MGALKNILLTGASGFLGSHLLKMLVSNRYNVIIILRKGSNTWRINDLLKKCRVVEMSNNEITEHIFEQYSIDTVVHAATEYGHGDRSLLDILQTNVTLPIRLFETGLENRLKVFINTDSFFSKHKYFANYLTDYVESKRWLEKYLKRYNGKDARIFNLRLEHIYGEYDGQNKFVTKLIEQLRTNTASIDLTDGTQKRDFVYIKDVVEAYRLILERFNEFEGYNEFEVGTGRVVTLREFVEKIACETQSITSLNFGALPQREGEILFSRADIAKLEELGYCPKYNIEEGIKSMLSKHTNKEL